MRRTASHEACGAWGSFIQHKDATVSRSLIDEPLNGRAPVLEDSTSFPSVEKKIAIVGKAPSSIRLAPYEDESWEIWGLSNAAFAGEVPRWNTWFELHNLDDGHKRWAQACPGYWSWLKQDHGEGKRIFVGRESYLAIIPNGVAYPWQRVFERFGRYFNNSISEMIAIAIMEGATELGIWGVDMAQSDPVLHNGNSEYQHQRPSCEFILGMVRAMGIKLHVPNESDLLKCHRVYAYEDAANDGLRVKLIARKKELQERHAQAVDQMNAHKRELEQWRLNCAKFEGALEDLNYILQRMQ